MQSKPEHMSDKNGMRVNWIVYHIATVRVLRMRNGLQCCTWLNTDHDNFWQMRLKG